jgi:hypothetical protein
LGAGLALGAAFTQWSAATNAILVLAGSVVCVLGLARNRRASPGDH